MRKKKNAEDFNTTREAMHREMLSAVSHDLKTPLASVIGSLEVYNKLKDRISAEKQHTLLKTALDEAYRLDNFITNILDMAKLENNMVKIKKEPLSLRSTVNDCLTRLGNKVDDAEIIIEGEDIVVQSDPNMLCRAIYLIADNALRHAGERPEIKVTYGGAENNFFISIEDNGPGIPDSKIKEVFSKYTRIARRDHQNAGTGLGLAICKQIILLLGGTVTAHNIPGSGARFEIRIKNK